MKKNRPVNLDLSTIRLPITALASITHRVTGVVLLAGVLGLMWMLDMSLSSAEAFAQLQSMNEHLLFKLALFAVLAALIYHSVAGVRHLIMDLGFGETKEGGRIGAQVSIAISVILIALTGVWLW